MTQEQRRRIEDYMLSCMADSAHDREHVYRVLHIALQIARTEPDADLDVLTAACLLHDIGRQDQAEDPGLCHARVGAGKAGRFLHSQGFEDNYVNHVCGCILTHRFRRECPPQSLEAKILFDADKLDVTGAVGIARTLMYQGDARRPLYTRTAGGGVSDGAEEGEDSFFREYRFKLEGIYDRFYTQKGRQMALSRRQAAVDFYERLLREIREDFAEAKESAQDAQ